MSSIKKNFIYNTTYQILTILIPIVTMPYISRVLGVEQIGEYSYAYAIAHYFVLFVMMGLNTYGNRTIAGIRGNKNVLSRTFWEIYSLQFFCGCIAISVYILYCICFGNSILSWIMIVSILSATLDINWFFAGLEKFRLTVSRNIIIKIFTTISIFVLVKEQDDIGIYVSIVLLGTLMSNIVLWLFLKNEIIWFKVRISDILKHIRPNLVLFIPTIAVSFYKYMDKIMLGFLSNMKQVGYYEYTEKVLQIPMTLINSLSMVMLPRMSNIVANSETGKEIKYIEISIDFAMFFSSSISFGLMGIAKEFVYIFYGSGYEPCIELFYILLPSCCFVAFANVVRTQYLIPHNKDKIFVEAVCIGAVVNTVINFILIGRLGAIGAAIGTLITEMVVCIFQCKKSSHELDIKKYVWNSLPFVFSGLGIFIILINLPFVGRTVLSTIILKVLVGFFSYFIILGILFFTLFKSRCHILKNYIAECINLVGFRN